MKKILSMFIIILLSLFSIDVMYQPNSSQTVLLCGKVMGFEFEDYNQILTNGELVFNTGQKLGTVTCIKKSTHEFVALGHPAITKYSNTNINGICHEIVIDEIDKSDRNHIGHIHGILKSNKQIGIVNKNNKFGIFGTIDEIKESECIEIETANRYETRLGTAELVIAFDNEKHKSYKIKVVGVNYMSDNKNIKIKIENNNLIEKTGGILEGMSGAPIVQNGKLIGAVNFANPNKPKEAYAIFIDKLI